MWRKRTRGQARRTDRGPRSGARTARHDPAVAPAASESGHAAAACPSSQLTCPSWAGAPAADGTHPWLNGRSDMKTKVRPDDASMLQLNDWLAALREDGRAEPPGDIGTEPPGGSTEPPADRVRPAAPAAGTWTEALSRGAGPAARSGVSRPVAPAGAASLAEAAVRA